MGRGEKSYTHQSPMRTEQRGQGGWMEGTSGVLLFLSIKLSLELRVTFWQSKQSDFYLLSQYGAAANFVYVCMHMCVCERENVCGFKKGEREREKERDGGAGWVPLKMVKKQKNNKKKEALQSEE